MLLHWNIILDTVSVCLNTTQLITLTYVWQGGGVAEKPNSQTADYGKTKEGTKAAPANTNF